VSRRRLVSFGRVVAAAHRLRERAELTKPPYSARTLIERCFPALVVTGESLPRGVFEATTIHDGKRIIVYNRRINTAAQRVAIAHGLAHLLFDLVDKRGRLECHGVEAREAAGGNHDAVERRADLFAGELLVPFDDLDAHFEGDLFPRSPAARRVFDDDVDHVASTFKVPPGFVRWRLFDLAWLRKTNFHL